MLDAAVTAPARPDAAPDEPATPGVTTAAPWQLRWAPAAVALTFAVVVLAHRHTRCRHRPVRRLRPARRAAAGHAGLPGAAATGAHARRGPGDRRGGGPGSGVGALACFSVVGAQRWLGLWPVAVVTLFVAVPALRRHWRVPRLPAGADGLGVVGGGGRHGLHLVSRRVLPAAQPDRAARPANTAQYFDLAFQMSIAGEATHNFPPNLPQVAGEPLHYHWFGFAHLGAASLVSGVDLPTVLLRLAVPALCALAVVLVAVVGWRVSGRPYVGATAAALMFTIGEFAYENGVRQLFGTQATFIVCGSQSMTYSWVLLLPLIAVLADVVGRAKGSAVPPLRPWRLGVGRPVAARVDRREGQHHPGRARRSGPDRAGAAGRAPPRRIATALAAGAMPVAAQVLATAVLFRFENHGVALGPLSDFVRYLTPSPSARPGWQTLMAVAVGIAFLLNMQLRLAGIAALLSAPPPRGRLEPVRAVSCSVAR